MSGVTAAELRHFYHLAADFGWEEPVTGHIGALREARLGVPVTIGITGTEAARADARERLARLWPEAELAEHDGPGFEDVTLALARDWAHDHRDGLVLYAHAKGSANASPYADAWRQSMTIDVVGGWRDAVSLLAIGEYDAAGPHWLDPAAYPMMRAASQVHGGSQTGYFGGNFWWATAAYLASLPPPSRRTRWDAERWIGLGRPRVLDLRPGWPSLMNFGGDLAAALLAEQP